MLIGFDSGYLNGVLGSVDFNNRFGEALDGGETYALTSTTRALFTSTLAAGTLIGCVLTAFIPIKCNSILIVSMRDQTNHSIVSRRAALVLASVIYSVGVALQVAAPNAASFIVGRVLLGLALGTISIVV